VNTRTFLLVAFVTMWLIVLQIGILAYNDISAINKQTQPIAQEEVIPPAEEIYLDIEIDPVYSRINKLEHFTYSQKEVLREAYTYGKPYDLGLTLAALIAGYKPDKNPIMIEKPNPIKTP